MKSLIASPVRLLGSGHGKEKNKLLNLSKIVLLLSLLFLASNTFYGQNSRAKEKVKSEAKNEVKTEVNKNGSATANNSKVNDAKETKADAQKTKADAKAKADKANNVANDPKGAVKTGAKNNVNATVNSNSNVNDAKQTKADAKAKADKANKVANDPKGAAKKTATDKTNSAKNEAAAKTKDKVTGEYNGKKLYTGPQGGQYYINSNGNKTYIKQ